VKPLSVYHAEGNAVHHRREVTAARRNNGPIVLIALGVAPSYLLTHASSFFRLFSTYPQIGRGSLPISTLVTLSTPSRHRLPYGARGHRGFLSIVWTGIPARESANCMVFIVVLFQAFRISTRLSEVL
jgi:hypothetical protein